MRLRWTWRLLPLLLTAFATLPAHGAQANHSQLELVSVGPTPLNHHVGFLALASADGSRVFFHTAEQLVAADTDAGQDIYQRAGGVTTLVSIGSNDDSASAFLAGISDDGTTVFFHSSGQLTPEDGDASQDVYRRESGVTALVSAGNGPFSASFDRATPDGSHVLFRTDEPVAIEDTDTAADVYERFGSTTRLVSTGPAGGNSGQFVLALAIADDGSRIVLETPEQLTVDDTDSVNDVYVRADGATDRVSTGPAGGNGPYPAKFNALAPNGLRVFFETDESLTADEPLLDCTTFAGFQTSCADIYERSSGVTTLISGPRVGIGGDSIFGGITAQGTRVFFETVERQAAGDDDLCFEEDSSIGCPDIFMHSGGVNTLMTPGGPDDCTAESSFCDVTFRAATEDGTYVFFETPMAMTPDDMDSCPGTPNQCSDVYEQSAATGTRLVSTGPTGAGSPNAATYRGSSDDGARVFFSTKTPLVPQDTDTSEDIYERYAGATTLLSGVSDGSGDSWAVPSFKAVSQDGSIVVFNTTDLLVASDTDGTNDVYMSSNPSTGPTGYARPKGATPVRFSLVPAAKPCTSPGHTHGPPLAFPSCHPPVPESPNLTVGVGDGSPAFPKSEGHVRIDVKVGLPGPPEQSDAFMRLVLTNVMNRSGLSDYTGELRASVNVRLTDRHGGAPATTQDFPFGFTVPCTATADTTLGGDCRIATTADAVLPGATVDFTRAIWALDQMRVFDGGTDGDADTPADNSLLAVQGVFVP